MFDRVAKQASTGVRCIPGHNTKNKHIPSVALQIIFSPACGLSHGPVSRLGYRFPF